VVAANTLPKPSALPFLGNLLDMLGDPLRFYDNLYTKYGDLVPFDINGYQCYLIANPQHIEYVLMNTGRSISKGYEYDVPLRRLLGNGLVTSEGPFWFRQRKNAAPAFHHERVGIYAQVMVDLTCKIMADWKNGDVKDLHHEMLVLTLRIISETLFGAHLGDNEDKLLKASRQAMNGYLELHFGLTRILPFSFPTPAKTTFYKAIEAMETIVYGIIAKHRAGEIHSEFISLMMNAEDENGNHLSDEQLRDEALTMLLAGHETTSNALSWTILLLCQNPQADERLAAEIKEQLGSRTPTMNDLKNLAYTDAVIKESMRLYPPVWALSRVNKVPIKLDDFEIATNSYLVLPQWLVHHSAKFFREPEKFRPERWLNGEADHLPKFAYFPFGGGPRVCIGNSFASMEAVLILSTIRQRFRFDVLNKEEVKPKPSVTLNPTKPISTRLLCT
jgi:cytochrome P450